jgi:hypothetical protein
MPPSVVANLGRLQKLVAAALNANPDDMSYAAATTDQGKYAPEHITDAILYIDLEVIRVGMETPGWGYRSSYLSSVNVSHGASIGAHPGKIGSVEIKLTSGGAYQRGIRVESIDVINKLLTNPDGRYGTVAGILGGRYYIDEELRIYFTGDSARVLLPTALAITTACQAPAEYEPTIARGAVAMLAKDPLDPSLAGFYGQQYQADLARIKGLEERVPPLDLFVKMGG